MQYVCDAPGKKAWFRIESSGEAALESAVMKNAIEVQYENTRRAAIQTYQPSSRLHFIERNIGLNAHIARTMPMFLTLRDGEGNHLANAMLPPCGRDDDTFASRIVGPGGMDALMDEAAAVEALERHFGLSIQNKERGELCHLVHVDLAAFSPFAL